MTVTRNIAKYVKDIGVNLSELSRKSGVPYCALYASLANNKSRELRANELRNCAKINLHFWPDDIIPVSKHIAWK